MNKRLLILCAAGAASLWGQRVTDRRSAEIRGGGGDEGKCTIEVVVDGTAQVEISGRNAEIRTINGNPATFRRFECNEVMPNRPYGFRFKGIDGRGNQQLVRSAENGGQAVIRIDDPKGGSEGYTFDIIWNGGNYNGRGPGNSGGGGYGGGDGRGYGRGGGGGGGYNNRNEEFLGRANVDGGRDHDEISVNTDQPFRELQLRVQNGDVNFQRVVVHYANGQSQEVRFASRMRAGTSSRWLDLPGDRRRIRSVELWYSRGRWGSNRPRVELYGRS
jgi:hypothetical protein